MGFPGWHQALAERRIIWQEHVLVRMIERRISRDEVIEVLHKADQIEEYPNDHPHPSVLLFGQIRGRVLHVVAAFDSVREAIHVVTAYEPDTDHFEAGYRRRHQT